MFSRMTVEQRLIVVNVGLFLAAAVAALLLMTSEPTVPAPPDKEAITAAIDRQEQSGSDLDTQQVKYEQFGEKDLFVMLVPFPTPSPTPPPTQPPDPLLKDAIKDWKLNGFGPNIVFIRDLKQNKDILIDLDDPASKTQIVRFQNQDMEVVLESIDDINMSATFIYNGRQGKQTETKKFFED